MHTVQEKKVGSGSICLEQELYSLFLLNSQHHPLKWLFTNELDIQKA